MIISVYYSMSLEFNRLMILLWSFTLIFLILATLVNEMKWYHTMRRMRFNLLFFILFWGHAVLILHNEFNLSINIIVLVSNAYVAVIKIILVKSY